MKVAYTFLSSAMAANFEDHGGLFLRSSTRTKRQAAPSRVSRWSAFSEWCLAHQRTVFLLVSGLWVFALYWRALSAPFVYDDIDQIVRNPALASLRLTFHRFWLSPVSFNSQIRGAGGSTYRPLYWMSFALDRRIWGVAAGFHLTNLILHWLNGTLVFLLLRRLRVAPLTAAVAALLWLGLPINTEAVAWVSGRGYLLCTFFVLLALVFADGYLRKPRSWALLAAYFAAALAALLSHEEGVLILPLTLLVAYATDRLSRRLAGWLAATSILAGLIYLALREAVRTSPGQTRAALWAVGLAFWRYVQWMVLPVHMSVERSTSTPINAASLGTIAGWVALIALVVAIVLLRKRMPKVAVGLVWVVVALLPFCGFIFIYQGMAERFEYLAAAGLALAAASLALEYAGAWRRVAIGCLALWMMWGAWRLRARVLDWNDPVTLYESSLIATPKSGLLLYNLGDQYRERGDLPKAVKRFEQALALNPKNRATAVNLAVALQQLGDKQGAEAGFRRAIALDPGQSDAFNDLGVLFTQEGRVDEAIQSFQKAIEDDPSDATPYFDLAVLFQQRGQDEVALAFYRKVLELKPGDPDTIHNLSKLHLGR
jgi:tetratricopeptide (TPR) repeat protein